jgi:hypothetical protein
MAAGKTFTAFHQYEPVEAPCIIFIVVFVLLLAAHLWQAVRARAWWIWPLVVATALEAIGYITRSVFSTTTTTTTTCALAWRNY